MKLEILDINLTVTRVAVRPEIQTRLFAEFDRIGYIEYYSRNLQIQGPAHIPVCIKLLQLIHVPV